MSIKRTLVIMPAHNEERSVSRVVRDVRSTTGLPVLVVNDGSMDDTSAEARSGGACVLELPCRLGAWLATQAGMRYAMAQGYDHVVTCDADGQHGAKDIQRLLNKLDGGKADVIVGCCTERGSRMRRVAWSLFRTMSRISLDDLTSGFRAYSARSVKVLASPMASLIDYQDMGILLLLRDCGLTVAECEVSMCPRRDGEKSRIFSSWFRVGEYMLLTIITILVKPGCRRRKRWNDDV